LARAVIGIDAEEIIPKYYGVGSRSKARFYDFIRKPRTIVIRIVLNPNRRINKTYSDLRDDLYRVISASRIGDVELRFKQDAVIVAAIKGKIVKFEAPHFSETPEVQITIQCEDAMLRGFEDTVLDDIELTDGGPVFYIYDAVSTAPHGGDFKFRFTADSPRFQIGAENHDWVFHLIHNFLDGDVLTISSRFGQKSATLKRNSQEIPVADKITPESLWPVIFPGANTYKLEEPTKYKIIEVSYLTAFWGV
jgi:hypothetical protein